MENPRNEGMEDILSITLNGKKEKADRMKAFVHQIKNPYCFMCGEIMVDISFSQNVPTMEEQFQLYLQQRFG